MISLITKGRHFFFLTSEKKGQLDSKFFFSLSVYVELADEYKIMDAISDVRRRNMLAQHLREVVDILEQKVRSISLSSSSCCFAEHGL